MSRSIRFARFMARPGGRLLRIVVGGAFIAGGFALGAPAGIALAIVGLAPLGAGLFNVCLVAPLLHVPFQGREVLAQREPAGSLT